MSKSFVITFAGDTSLGDWYLNKPNRSDVFHRLKTNPMSFFEGVTSLLQGSDHLILNLETVLYREPPIFHKDKKYPNWDDPERTISALKQIGVTAVNLANNHTMDFGPDILLETRRLLLENGIEPFGAGHNENEASAPLKLSLQGEHLNLNIYVLSGMRSGKRYREKFGFYATSDAPGISSLDVGRLSSTIKGILAQDPGALIIVYPHWQGYDYKHVSNITDIKSKCDELLEAGARFVIGHGTHMADEILEKDNGLVILSIGNLVFNSPGRYQKLGVPPNSYVVQMTLREQESSWGIDTNVHMIETDNRKTNYRTRLLNKPTSLSYTYCHKPVENLPLVSKPWEKVDVRGDQLTQPHKNSQNEVLQYILGSMDSEDFDFDKEENITHYIDALDEAHRMIDERFKRFYKVFMRSKHLKHKVSKNFSYFNRLKSIIKKDYISYSIMRQFAHRKLNMEKTMSFQGKIIEMLEGRRYGIPVYGQWMDKKDVAYRFADRVGLRRPKTDPRLYMFNEIAPQDGPVVIKPTTSTGSMGVYLVFNSKRIFSVRDGCYLSSWNDLVADVEKKMEQDRLRVRKYLKKDEWMIEELIVGPEETEELAPDLKFYSFYGEVPLVLEAIRKGNDRYQFWNAEQEKVFTGKYEEPHRIYREATGFSKHQLQEMINVSLEMPVPFMRIDMLKGKNDLVFGEATYYPGNFQDFNSEWDQKLGEAYHRAEARIKKDLLEGKEFNAFKDVIMANKKT